MRYADGLKEFSSVYFFKKKTAYDMRIRDWSSDVCSSDLLQFKKVSQTEIFTHTDHSSTAFGYIPLPEVIVEARAPVEYTYYLDLEEPWRQIGRASCRERECHYV